MKMNQALILSAVLALGPLGAARADSQSSIAFSDPSKPGTLKVRVWHGNVDIRGSDAKEVSVKANTNSAEPTPRKDGMRVLSATAGYSLSEKGNIVTLDYSPEGWSEGSTDFEVTVPRSTTVVVADSVHGDVDCSGVTGDIDIRTVHGDVKLDGVSAGALVETVKGDIDVTVKGLAEAKPLSFTSMSGEVVIHAPADLKASVRFRTHRGTILTNFDDKALVTKTEYAKRSHKDKKLAAKAASSDMKEAGTDATASTSATASASAKASADGANAKGQSDDDWREGLRDSIREATVDAVEAARDAAEAAREGIDEARVEMAATRPHDGVPPIPPLPPMTGGKTVSGTLNGGGIEIQAATLNGDITLKKIE
jgi:hypothetical protein